MKARMRPESIIAEKKIEKNLKNIPKRTFTVLDFIETLKRLHPPKIGMPSEMIWTFGGRGSTRSQRTFQTGSMCTRINHLQFSSPSLGVQRADSQTIGRPLMKRERLSKPHDSCL
jgi:hypothetical protein